MFVQRAVHQTQFKGHANLMQHHMGREAGVAGVVMQFDHAGIIASRALSISIVAVHTCQSQVLWQRGEGENCIDQHCSSCHLLRFDGATPPTPEQLQALHHQAHESCCIAGSATTKVRCEARF